MKFSESKPFSNYKIIIQDERGHNVLEQEWQYMSFVLERGVEYTYAPGQPRPTELIPNGQSRIQIRAWDGVNNWDDYKQETERWDGPSWGK